MTGHAQLPNSSSPVVVWRCDDCGWTILDDDAVDGQPCEAWLDGETEEHGTCLRLVMVPAKVTDEMVERVAVGMVGNGDPDYWCCLSEPQKEWHRGRARRALDAAFRICAMRGDEPPRTEATDRQAPGE